MATTSVLRELDHARWCLVWVVEGVEFFWTDHSEVSALDFCGDGRGGKNGLQVDQYGGGIDFTAYHGQFRNESWQVKILDDRNPTTGAGTLASLFAVYDATETPLVSSISPREHLGGQGSLWNQHIGVEAIDSAGARARFPCMPNFRFGHEHIGENYETSEAPISTVSEKPIVFRGRRCALYTVFFDHVDGTGWRPWSEAVRSWCGTIRDAGTVDGRVWTLEIDGPESWLYRRVGTLTDTPPPPDYWPVKVSMQLSNTDGNNETLIGAHLRSQVGDDGSAPEYYGHRIFVAGDAIPNGLTPSELANHILGVIATTAAANNGTDGVFTGAHGQEVSMTLDGGVGIKTEQDVPARLAILDLCLHEKVWKALGYDPAIQAELSLGDQFWVPFLQVQTFPLGSDDETDMTSLPGPGYWEARFNTRALGILPGYGADSFADNDGQKRFYKPLYAGGTQVIPHNLPPDGLLVDLIDGIAHHTGQLDRPVPSKSDDPNAPPTIGGLPCDTQGLMLFFGPRRVLGLEGNAFGEDEETVVARVARCTWVKAAGKYAQITSPPAQVLVMRWLQQNLVGLDAWDGGMGDWVGLYNAEADKQIKAVPLLRLGYTQDGHFDNASGVIQRLLYTTGTNEGWSNFENGNPEPTMNSTSNEPAGAGVRRDAEVADLGLRVPKDLIEDVFAWKEVFDGLGDGAYLEHSLAVRPGFDLADFYKGLFTAYGLCWHFRDGKFGVFSYPDVLTHDDVEVELTLSQKAGDLDGPGPDRVTQELRAGAPIDEFVLEYDWNPHEQKFRKSLRQRSNDKGSRYRQGGNVVTAKVHGIRDPTGWVERIQAIAAFWEKRHFYIRNYPVKGRRPGSRISMGTVVRLTEPGAVTQTGTYGATGLIGIVTKVRHTGLQPDKDGKREHITYCDIFVQADSAVGVRLTGPMAVGIAYDPATGDLAVKDNAFGMTDPDHFDVHGFVEPSWSPFGGGRMKVKGLQWNGVSTSENFTAEVASYNAETENSKLVLVNFSGTYYRDMDTLILAQDMDQQTATWVQSLFGVVCDKNGKWGGALNNGYPWH